MTASLFKISPDNNKRMIKGIILAALVIFSMISLQPRTGRTQIFGQFTSAAISSEGEGGFFTTAGENIFRAAAVSRFLLSSMSDLGIQAGIENMCDTYSYGGSLDVKFYLIRGEPLFPLDLALDLSYGHMRSEKAIRNIFGGSLLVSRVFTTGLRFPIEPYLSLNIFSTQYSDKPDCTPSSRSCWPCKEDQSSSETDNVLRAGVRFKVGEDIHLIAEGEIDGENYLGFGVNIIY